MSERHFLLMYRLDAATSADEIVERLGAAGLTDALVGMGREGILALEYSLESHSAQSILDIEIQRVREFVPEVSLISVEPRNS